MLELLFICAHWHGLAKLRLHSDNTLHIMDDVTAELGTQFREFCDKICPEFQTRELPREAAARRRRCTKGNRQSGANTGTDTKEPHQKNFNLEIYKYHSLGDYAATIRRLGTTDSYSTTTVHTSSTVTNLLLITGMDQF